MERPTVGSREGFLAFLFDLLDHVDAVQPDNDSVYTYIQAAAAWLNEADAFYLMMGEAQDTSEANWQVFADLLWAALTRS